MRYKHIEIFFDKASAHTHVNILMHLLHKTTPIKSMKKKLKEKNIKQNKVHTSSIGNIQWTRNDVPICISYFE